MKKDLAYHEAVKKYPNFPRFTILKIDLYRRGIMFSGEVIKECGRRVYAR